MKYNRNVCDDYDVRAKMLFSYTSERVCMSVCVKIVLSLFFHVMMLLFFVVVSIIPLRNVMV